MTLDLDKLARELTPAHCAPGPAREIRAAVYEAHGVVCLAPAPRAIASTVAVVVMV